MKTSAFSAWSKWWLHSGWLIHFGHRVWFIHSILAHSPVFSSLWFLWRQPGRPMLCGVDIKLALPGCGHRGPKVFAKSTWCFAAWTQRWYRDDWLRWTLVFVRIVPDLQGAGSGVWLRMHVTRPALSISCWWHRRWVSALWGLVLRQLSKWAKNCTLQPLQPLQHHRSP